MGAWLFWGKHLDISPLILITHTSNLTAYITVPKSD